MQQTEASNTFATPLGAVRITVAGAADAVILFQPVMIPALPAGMAVDGVALATVSLPSGVDEGALVTLHVTAEGEAGAETGEWLESVSFWHESDAILQVATRDCEWLAGRGVVADWVDYTAHGFTQTIWRAPENCTLHVSVAWLARRSKWDDVSTWFAADLALPDQPVFTSPTASTSQSGPPLPPACPS